MNSQLEVVLCAWAISCVHLKRKINPYTGARFENSVGEIRQGGDQKTRFHALVKNCPFKRVNIPIYHSAMGMCAPESSIVTISSICAPRVPKSCAKACAKLARLSPLPRNFFGKNINIPPCTHPTRQRGWSKHAHCSGGRTP